MFDIPLFTIFAFIVTVFSIFLTAYSDVWTQNPPNALSRLFNKKNEIYLTDFKAKSIYPKAIFAFDNSGSVKKNITSTYLKEIYIKYIDKIKNQGLIDFDSYKEKNKQITYRDFLRAKLCSDIIDCENRDGKFYLFIIGNETRYLLEGEQFSKQMINECISLLYSLTESENNTDFKHFFEMLEKDFPMGHKNVFQNSEYVLYIYSDFIHDNGRRRDQFNEEIQKIKKSRKTLFAKNVLQNLFIITTDNNTIGKLTFNVLANDNIVNNIYENQYLLEDISPEDKIPFQIVFSEKYLPIFYVSPYYCDSEIKILLDDSDCEFKLRGNSDDRKQYYLINGDQCHLLSDSYVCLKSNDVTLKFTGYIPGQYSSEEIEIVSNKIHYFIKPIFYKDLPYILKWIIPIIIFVFSFFLTGSILYFFSGPTSCNGLKLLPPK
jgi:hypothetical protein